MQECKLLALHQMVQRFAQIVDKVTWVNPESPQDDDAVNAVATLYHNKAHGVLNLPSIVCRWHAQSLDNYSRCKPKHRHQARSGASVMLLNAVLALDPRMV